ncbi:hypothetical protein [Phytoactinopolyspora halotolerans]|uniref:Uncharacterized protein n=1 Tax=Phytoactinopolyspora halotolerans TaxID=1981512 RepID=A0A6L9S354_9ACTN|nr:hypothetical protein [Phytoactinopolyspora halotolerans]NED99834.1 hypothetical protein [Phytoactinopolyspora halotolerans]
MRRWYIGAPLAGIGSGLFAFVIGVQGWRPILIGVVVAGALIWSKRYWPEGSYFPWPLRGPRLHGGGSHQVARLTSSISQRIRARTPDPSLQYRLRRLATARLRRLGLAWDDPRAVQLLGKDVHDALGSDEFNPDLRSIEVIIGVIERLDDAAARSDLGPAGSAVTSTAARVAGRGEVAR